MTLLVIRHAHAGDPAAWDGDDDRRPLSSQGRRQAEALEPLLAPLAIERILSSPSDRCVQTVAPLAAARGIEVELRPELTEGTATADVRDLLRSLADTDAALCSHGEVIGDLVGSLVEDGVDLGPDPAWEKGSTWILGMTAGGVTSAVYLPPPFA